MYDHLPATLTLPQVCHELQLGQRTVLNLINSGKLPALWLSKRCVRIPREAFISFLSGVQPSTPVHPLFLENPTSENQNNALSLIR